MSFEILDPTTSSRLPRHELAARLDTLAGRRIWFLDNQGEQWGGARDRPLLNPIFRTWQEKLERELDARVSYACTEQFTSPFRHGKETFEQVAAEADAVVCGLACCGSGTSAVIHDAVQYERRAIPTLSLITDNVVPFARSAAYKLGLPDLRTLTVSHHVHAFAPIAPYEECRAVAEQMFAAFAAALTKAG